LHLARAERAGRREEELVVGHSFVACNIALAHLTR
jgi:hypothetical protein